MQRHNYLECGGLPPLSPRELAPVATHPALGLEVDDRSRSQAPHGRYHRGDLLVHDFLRLDLASQNANGFLDPSEVLFIQTLIRPQRAEEPRLQLRVIQAQEVV